MFSSFADVLIRHSKNRSDRTAFIFLENGEQEAGRLTFGELHRSSQAIAAVLQEAAAIGDRALLIYPPGLDFIAAFIGCLYAGVVAVPMSDPQSGRALIRGLAVARDAGARVVLTTKVLLSSVEQQAALPTESLAATWIATDVINPDRARGWREVRIDRSTMAFLQYTSGSTGSPRGVMVTHGNLLANSEMVKVAFAHSEETIQVSWLPLFHDMGLIGCVLQPIYVGALGVLMAPAAFVQKPVRWLQALSTYKGNTSGAPNSAYEACVKRVTKEQRASLDLSNWKVAFNGAEPIRAATVKRFTETFGGCGFRPEAMYPCYGMAEATLFVTGSSPYEEPVFLDVDPDALEQGQVTTPRSGISRTLVSSGRSWLDQEIMIVDPETQSRCTDGSRIGEIWISGAHVTSGYWNRSEETELTFRGRLADGSTGGFLRTGDLGFLKEGELFVTGRSKDLIIIRGRNHYPQDIEDSLEACHPAIQPNASAAFPIEADLEERVVAVCEIKRAALADFDPEAVMAEIRRAVAEEHGIDLHAIVLLKTSTIPKTTSGKIQRRACKSAYLSGSGLEIIGQWRQPEPPVQDAVISPAKARLSFAEIQSWLVDTVASLTNIAPQEINPRDPFTRYGLDSQRAIMLSGAIEEWLGSPQPVTLAYDYPSIEILARHLSCETGFATDAANEPDSGAGSSDIAIIGMGCRFPGAGSLDQYWQMLREGVDAIGAVPSSRWDADKWRDAALGGFIDEIDQFDPEFFGISPREAELMDPQQRILLEVAWESLENAGCPPDKLAGTKTGVFVGISNTDYSRMMAGPQLTDAYFGTGAALSIAANRLSYFLDLRGPSWSVDTACSSSLAAVHQACQSLNHGECNLAIVGGVNLIIAPELTMAFSQAGMMSPAGRCKTFDESADGYVRGEGCGVVVLRQLADALRKGDNLLAVIKGSAVNQDGRTNGLTAPNGPAQQAVIREALRNAGVKPSEVTYVEAHGTGTALGDPIEMSSIKEVLCQGRKPDEVLWVGSVKSNIGHLESAAGMAGLIKVVLALNNGEIPPHLHLKKLNPHISLEGEPIRIPVSPQPWSGQGKSAGNRARIAGISSFGFGGTNAHLILEEGEPPASAHEPDGRPLQILTMSARTEPALRQLAQSTAELIENRLSQHRGSIGDLAFSANTGRARFNHRAAFVVSSEADALKRIDSFLSGNADQKVFSGQVEEQSNSVIAFLFTGQGSQYVKMGRELFETQPEFRRTLEQCEEILRPVLKEPLLKVIYPIEGAASPIDNTEYAQPALFALEYALAQLWKSWGVLPSVVMGHSIGEYVAACFAGVFSLEDGLKLVAARGRLMQSLDQAGGMASVFAPADRVIPFVRRYDTELSIAAINSPEQTVISGSARALEKAAADLKAAGIDSRPLVVSHAFHSPLMQPILNEFYEAARRIEYKKAQIGVISNISGAISNDAPANADYWRRHVLSPVDFAGGMKTLDSHGCDVLIEIGPKPTLLSIGKKCISPEGKLWLPSLRMGRSDWLTLLESLALASVSGVNIDWAGFDRDYKWRRIDLPAYPFQRQRCWIEESPNDTKAGLSLLGRRLPQLAHLSGTHAWEVELNGHTHPYLRGHQIFGNSILPYAIYVEMALAAAREVLGAASNQLLDLEIHHPVLIRDDESATLQLVLSREANQLVTFKAYNRAPSSHTKNNGSDRGWVLCASARIQAD